MSIAMNFIQIKHNIMKYKVLVTAFFFILIPSFILSQTLELFGQKVTFGASLSEQKNDLWKDGGQIESEYPYIEIYEGDNAYAGLYNGKLVYFQYIAHDNNQYPVCEDIENILSNLTPYKQYTETEGIGAFVELYKTNEYYISRSSSRMNTDYSFVPIKRLENIRNKHPEYLNKLF